MLTLHLVALGFLRFAVVGGAIHILPTLLRTSDSCWRPADGAASPLRAAGPVLAYGIAHDQVGLWPAFLVGAALASVDAAHRVLGRRGSADPRADPRLWA